MKNASGTALVTALVIVALGGGWLAISSSGSRPTDAGDSTNGSEERETAPRVVRSRAESDSNVQRDVQAPATIEVLTRMRRTQEELEALREAALRAGAGDEIVDAIDARRESLRARQEKLSDESEGLQ